jgi:hypothetical protein
MGCPYQGMNGGALHAWNREAILRCIKSQEAVTRCAIARQTGLLRATVSQIVRESARSGVIHEGPRLRDSPSLRMAVAAPPC